MSDVEKLEPIEVMGVPLYNRPDLLDRLIASVDYPVEVLVLVLQGPGMGFEVSRFAAEVSKNPHIKRVEFSVHKNYGVAGAWNEIIKNWPARGWLLVNNDIQFAPGDLKRLMARWRELYVEAGQSADKDGVFTVKPVSTLYGNHGASWFMITLNGVVRVGLFDENIFPAYLEDCDWSYRCDLLKERRITVEGCMSVHGEPSQQGSCTVNATPELQRENSRTHGLNYEYYRAKWGGLNGCEVYLTPFNLGGCPKTWNFLPELRRGRQWKVKG